MTEEKLTKPKSQGRVEAGKKLAEWNRAQKAKLKQELAQKPVQVAQEPDPSTSSSTLQVPAQVPASHKSLYLLPLITAVVLGVGYVWRRPSRAETEVKAESKTTPIYDPFKG